jgi:hypothetical protein
VKQLLGHFNRAGGLRHRQQQRELVAAQTCQDVRFVQDAA